MIEYYPYRNFIDQLPNMIKHHFELQLGDYIGQRTDRISYTLLHSGDAFGLCFFALNELRFSREPDVSAKRLSFMLS